MTCRRWTTWASLLLILCFLWSVLLTPRVVAQATPVPAAGPRYTPVIQHVSSPLRWFLGPDERVHLAYELLLTNAFPVPITVTSVDVLDAGSGRSITVLDGDALQAATSLLSVPRTPTVILPPSTIGVVWFDIPLANEQEIPAVLEHRLTIAVPPGLPVPESISSIGGEATVDQRPPVVLRAPCPAPGSTLGSDRELL